MSTPISASLSLEEGAAHLTALLRDSARMDDFPLPLQELWQAQAAQAHLQQLFTELRHKEDWKYTPVDFFRLPWALGQVELLGPSSFESALAPAERVAPSETLPALSSFPTPASPWEALVMGASLRAHYRVSKQGHVSWNFAGKGGLTTQLLTVSLEPHAEGEVWLNPQGEGFMIVRVHLHLSFGAQARLYLPTYLKAPNTYLYIILSAEQEAESRLEGYDLTAAVSWKRLEVKVRLRGKGAVAHLLGAARVGLGESMDYAIRVEHAAPHTESNQLFKSLVYPEGRSTFQGRIFVHRQAQKTNAYQSHKALLWDRKAVAYSRPQLEIFADDVRCTHGVTTGFMEGEILTYLRTRGIPEAQARQLLAQAFLEEVIGRVPHEGLQEAARRWIEA
ncbi:MAG: SufD family Fe-S cluster assembly protein [Bacteroidia bacterium]|nr:SufD family Fe-S cluster assembly protein [Bacteroidia bacterium]MDW8088277.1 SufD family Fe-S cluster assembly protein [Bacteroidia bacterium]